MKRTGSGKKKEPSQVRLSFNKNFLPPLTGLFVGLSVLGLMNSQYLAAKIAEATFKPTDISHQLVKKPVSNNPLILIDNINVKAPVIYDIKKADESNFQLALRDGVVHYPGTALPGEQGNVVIFGHSSGQVWAPGNYKFVFTHLSKLKNNNKIHLEYEGKRYIYNVYDKKVVAPTEISVLNQSGKKRLTLITCTPVGTSKNRLIIYARQIVPNPNANLSEGTIKDDQLPEQTSLPSSESPSLLDSIRELFN